MGVRESAGVAKDDKLYTFAAEALDGSPINISSYRNKVLLLTNVASL